MPNDQVVRLSAVVSDRLLEVPDYQRPYSWEKQQLDDLWEDLDLLGPSRTHYAGTLVLRRVVDPAGRAKESIDDAGDTLSHCDVVDGQQRLTTCLILLDRIRRRLQSLGAEGEERAVGVASSLRGKYGVTTVDQVQVPRLRLGTELNEYWKDNLLGDEPYSGPSLLPGQRRLRNAKGFFDERLEGLRSGIDNDTFLRRLLDLQRRVTSGLGFLVYEVSDLAEVGVIFETLNERGRQLSELEKAKNYLLYLARIIPDGRSEELAQQINHAWTVIFRNLSGEDGLDDQLLRSHWLATEDPDRRRWERIKSVKRRFDRSNYVSGATRIAPTQTSGSEQESAWNQLFEDVSKYVRTLRDSSYFLAEMFDEKAAFESFDSTARIQARNRGQALLRSGIIAPYRPLLLAARLARPHDGDLYCRLVDVAETYSARVFVILQRRTNAGEPRLLQLAHKLYRGEIAPDEVVADFEAVLWEYAPDAKVREALDSTDENWYNRRGHKYFLYEYERSLLRKGEELLPLVSFSDRSGTNRTTEHILPQNPAPDAACWWDNFTADEHLALHHALGNLALTLDNSSYSNKCFALKRGSALEPGAQPQTCYAQGGLHQERELAQYNEWTPTTIAGRQSKLAEWALAHWSVAQPTRAAIAAVADDEIESEGEDPVDGSIVDK